VRKLVVLPGIVADHLKTYFFGLAPILLRAHRPPG
jgi:hypothetical protein